MAPVLTGLRVVDLSTGLAGSLTTMLLGDYGADVVKVEPPGGDPLRAASGSVVWLRNKRSAVLDLHDPADQATCRRLVAGADVVVDTFAPGAMGDLGLDVDAARAANPGLVWCSITAYGRNGRAKDRPAYDALVQARWGLQDEQPGLRPGPIFLHLPLPSFGAALMASVGINAALLARDRTGEGQWVETSLAQGVLAWMTQIWKRAETPTPALTDLWRFKELPPTPCFEASDGQWFHPMPQAVPVVLAHLGIDASTMPPGSIASGGYEERTAYFARLQELFRMRPMAEWVELLQRSDVPCQPIGRAEDAFDHPQVVNNRASTVVDVPGVGPVKQFGHAYHLEHHDEAGPVAPPSVGQHTDELLAALATGEDAHQPPSPARHAPTGKGPLDGIRILDFGTALAGPFGAMVLSDLGADVIKIDPVGPQVGTPADATYAAGQRGKRSIAIDLKHPSAGQVLQRLIASADVIHYNLRTGVAERLGFGYEQAKAINPRIVHSHLTSYGNTGPLAMWPGVDQMGQAIAGLEYEQGATPNGGHPTWYRFGMCDATSGLMAAIGILQALRQRNRTDQPHWVEANILSGAMFLASDAVVGPDGLPERLHLDRWQLGLGPLHRLYDTADGWLCLAALDEAHWDALCTAVGRPELRDDARFATPAARQLAGAELAEILGEVLATKAAAEWFDVLDGHGIPCELATGRWGEEWYDDPDVVAQRWVTDYVHPVWGRMAQPGRMVTFSSTQGEIVRPPPVVGSHTDEVLAELGFDAVAVAQLRADGAVAG